MHVVFPRHASFKPFTNEKNKKGSLERMNKETVYTKAYSHRMPPATLVSTKEIEVESAIEQPLIY